MNPDTPRNIYIAGPIIGWRQAKESEVEKLHAEVAMLRELLNRAIEIAGNYEIAGLPRDGFMLHWKTNKYEFAKLKARLAPAPEEPVIKESLTTEPATEWRELGPDEVIQEGDEWRWGAHWFQCKAALGYKMNLIDGVVRTRRPLPRREGEQPYCSRCKYNHAFPCEGSLAGVPLEEELDYLTKEASRAADIHSHVVIVDCIRYLRNEIETLKKNQK